MSALASKELTSLGALQTAREVLRNLADYRIDPALDQMMLVLGERKEFLAPHEHAELMAWVGFTQQRTIEKLNAELALQRLSDAFPELKDQS
jgi:hypothetical protein